MIRGLISGLFSGTAVAALLVVGASQVLPVVDISLPEPDAGAVAVPAGSGFNAERTDVAPVLPGTEGRPAASNIALSGQSGDAELPQLDTSPAGAPETGVAEGLQDTPDTGDAPVVAVTGDSVSIPGDTEPLVQPGVDASPEQVDPLETPAVSGADQTELDAPLPGDVPVIVAGTDAAVIGDDAGQPPAQPETDDSPVSGGSADLPEAETGDVAIVMPGVEVDNMPVGLSDSPQGIGIVLPEISGISPGAEADSLPRIGAAAPGPEVESLEPALTRYAVMFDNSSTTPLLSIVLFDENVGPFADDLAQFPIPLTIAIDPLRDDAGARMAAYRAAGAEVVVLAPLPEGATPADVEVIFQSYLAAVPQSVAVLDLPAALFQENRPRAAQVVGILAETGHGMITYERGLNSALQIAGVEGVAAATVFRVFDDGTKDFAAIKRFLDQGAFRAGQDGGAVMVGMMRPDVMAAISEWALGNRAATVSLAPVSAVLSEK